MHRSILLLFVLAMLPLTVEAQSKGAKTVRPKITPTPSTSASGHSTPELWSPSQIRTLSGRGGLPHYIAPHFGSGFHHSSPTIVGRGGTFFPSLSPFSPTAPYGAPALVPSMPRAELWLSPEERWLLPGGFPPFNDPLEELLERIDNPGAYPFAPPGTFDLLNNFGVGGPAFGRPTFGHSRRGPVLGSGWGPSSPVLRSISGFWHTDDPLTHLLNPTMRYGYHDPLARILSPGPTFGPMGPGSFLPGGYRPGVPFSPYGLPSMGTPIPGIPRFGPPSPFGKPLRPRVVTPMVEAPRPVAKPASDEQRAFLKRFEQDLVQIVESARAQQWPKLSKRVSSMLERPDLPKVLADDLKALSGMAREIEALERLTMPATAPPRSDGLPPLLGRSDAIAVAAAIPGHLGAVYADHLDCRKVDVQICAGDIEPSRAVVAKILEGPLPAKKDDGVTPLAVEKLLGRTLTSVETLLYLRMRADNRSAEEMTAVLRK